MYASPEMTFKEITFFEKIAANECWSCDYVTFDYPFDCYDNPHLISIRPNAGKNSQANNVTAQGFWPPHNPWKPPHKPTPTPVPGKTCGDKERDRALKEVFKMLNSFEAAAYSLYLSLGGGLCIDWRTSKLDGFEPYES